MKLHILINPFVSTHFLMCIQSTTLSDPEVVFLVSLQVEMEVLGLFSKPHWV